MKHLLIIVVKWEKRLSFGDFCHLSNHDTHLLTIAYADFCAKGWAKFIKIEGVSFNFYPGVAKNFSGYFSR